MPAGVRASPRVLASLVLALHTALPRDQGAALAADIALMRKERPPQHDLRADIDGPAIRNDSTASANASDPRAGLSGHTATGPNTMRSESAGSAGDATRSEAAVLLEAAEPGADTGRGHVSPSAALLGAAISGISSGGPLPSGVPLPAGSLSSPDLAAVAATQVAGNSTASSSHATGTKAAEHVDHALHAAGGLGAATTDNMSVTSNWTLTERHAATATAAAAANEAATAAAHAASTAAEAAFAAVEVAKTSPQPQPADPVPDKPVSVQGAMLAILLGASVVVLLLAALLMILWVGGAPLQDETVPKRPTAGLTVDQLVQRSQNTTVGT